MTTDQKIEHWSRFAAGALASGSSWKDSAVMADEMLAVLEGLEQRWRAEESVRVKYKHCPNDCPYCSGEKCSMHKGLKCQCDVISRHSFLPRIS